MDTITVDRAVLEMVIKKLHMLLLPVPAKETTAIMLAKRVSVLATEVCGLLQKALAQPQQEPVAVMQLYASGWDLVEDVDLDWLHTLPFGTILYTSPPALQKPLTNEEIDVIWEQQRAQPFKTHGEDRVAFARAIEAAHGIKESK